MNKTDAKKDVVRSELSTEEMARRHEESTGPQIKMVTPTQCRNEDDRIGQNFWCKHCGPGNKKG